MGSENFGWQSKKINDTIKNKANEITQRRLGA